MRVAGSVDAGLDGLIRPEIGDEVREIGGVCDGLTIQVGDDVTGSNAGVLGSGSGGR